MKRRRIMRTPLPGTSVSLVHTQVRPPKLMPRNMERNNRSDNLRRLQPRLVGASFCRPYAKPVGGKMNFAENQEETNVQSVHHLPNRAATNGHLRARPSEYHDVWSPLCHSEIPSSAKPYGIMRSRQVVSCWKNRPPRRSSSTSRRSTRMGAGTSQRLNFSTPAPRVS